MIKKKIFKKIFAIAFLAMLILPATTSFAAPLCPAYSDGHRFHNERFIGTRTQKSTHYPTKYGGPCTITGEYKLFKASCSCGYETPSGARWVLDNENHSVNHN